jgi:hypothetical protein
LLDDSDLNASQSKSAIGLVSRYQSEGKAGATASAAHANTSSPETIDIADAGGLHRDAFHVADLDQRGDDRPTADAAAWRAGAAARNEYAQAQPPSGAHDTTHIDHNAIGRVDKIVGNVTVMRNGVAVVLHTGDAVFKGDVIQTGGGSTIRFERSPPHWVACWRWTSRPSPTPAAPHRG